MSLKKDIHWSHRADRWLPVRKFKEWKHCPLQTIQSHCVYVTCNQTITLSPFQISIQIESKANTDSANSFIIPVRKRERSETRSSSIKVVEKKETFLSGYESLNRQFRVEMKAGVESGSGFVSRFTPVDSFTGSFHETHWPWPSRWPRHKRP